MNKPKLTKSELLNLISAYKDKFDGYSVYIVFIRGYYKNSLGKFGTNDRGIYDDAAFILTPDSFHPFNANVDPQSYRKGYGFGPQKGIAQIKANIVNYCWKLDYHKNQYLALCQRLGLVTVIRDGDPPYEQTSAYLGINSHRGGFTAVNSLGCATIPPSQYDEYIAMVQIELKKYHGDILTGSVNAFGRPTFKDIIVPFLLIEM